MDRWCLAAMGVCCALLSANGLDVFLIDVLLPTVLGVLLHDDCVPRMCLDVFRSLCALQLCLLMDDVFLINQFVLLSILCFLLGRDGLNNS
uniref:Uncharacterized protein n=1 Tax=Picea glauca TaxID=3330 RepID=A0A101M4V9_PICGL|nr:hypothetical protein ABT39_MTgene982 [Picea glauca]QHR92227.1 hypothetical protein Q903MT_gene6266 [Picea sitchensis]